MTMIRYEYKRLGIFNQKCLSLANTGYRILYIAKIGDKMMNIKIELLQDGRNVKGFVNGEIDAFTAPILKEKLAEINLKDNLHVELNLTDVSYMDSTGLGVFVGFYKRINTANSHLQLTGLSSRLKRLFDITGLGEIMDIQTTSKEVERNETV